MSRRVGEGTMGPVEVPDLSPSDHAKIELLDLGDAGFRIFRPSDLDWTHDPWLVAKDDGTVWRLMDGMPLSGYRPNTNAVLVGKNNSWAYLTTAAASGISNPPRDLAELERRARERDEQAKRQAVERERELAALRKSARPVTAADVDPALGMTLRAAATRVEEAGGKFEVAEGRVIVSLPPGASAYGREPVAAAHVLYLAEAAVVPLLKSGKPLPDAFITPAGAVLT